MRYFKALFALCLLTAVLCLAACSESSNDDPATDGDTEADGDYAESDGESSGEDGDSDGDAEYSEESESEQDAAEEEDEGEAEAELLDTPNDRRDLQPTRSDDPYYKEVGALDGTAAGLPSNDVLRFVAAADGRLLALTAAGPVWYKSDEEKWLPYVYRKDETDIPYIGIDAPGMGLILVYDDHLSIAEGDMAGKTLALGGTITALCAKHNAEAPGLLLGFAEGWLNLWAGEDTKKLQNLREGESASVNDCVFSADDSTLFVATADGLLLGESLDTLTALPFPESETPPVPAALAVFEDQLLIGSDSGLFIYQLGLDPAEEIGRAHV